MRPAIEVTQADREAAISGYYAWCSGNPVIPNKIASGVADDHSMVQAFARHRIAAAQAERAAVVEYLRSQGDNDAADKIEAGEHRA